jgi:hypothetical protein
MSFGRQVMALAEEHGETAEPRLFSGLLESAPDAVVIVDADRSAHD